LETRCHNHLAMIVGSKKRDQMFLCSIGLLFHFSHAFSPDASLILSLQLYDLRLDEQTRSAHLLRLRKTHALQNCWRNISKNTILVLETPAFWSVGHDERNEVHGVRCLWSVLLVEHLLGVAIIWLA